MGFLDKFSPKGTAGATDEKTIDPSHIDVINPDGTEIVYDGEDRANRFKQKKSISDIISIICCGVALISDGYQNNLMTMTNAVFKKLYPTIYTSTLSTRVSNSLLVGEVLGMIVIGLTCDYLGRKWAIVSTTVLIVVGAILVTAAHGANGSALGMFWMIIVCRGAIGFGVGGKSIKLGGICVEIKIISEQHILTFELTIGEYAACSSSSSEAANETTKRRGGVFVLVTNLPLALGGPLALVIFLIVYSAAGGDHLPTVWRVCMGIGCVWPLAVFYFRYKMAMNVLYKKSALRTNVPYSLIFKHYWPRLIGTCGCWFIYDFVTFPNGIFSSTIISSVLGPETTLKETAEWTLLLTIIALPGVFLGSLVVDKIGRKYLLMAGFTGYLVIGLVIGCAYYKIKKIVPLFVVFYGIFNSFGNFGPGNCMGLVSSESFATPVRGTLYGLSAAFGKAGAAIGTQCFTAIENNLGKQWTFIIAAILGSVGVVLAYFTIPDLSDSDLMLEDVKFEKYLRENGWTGKFGVDDDSSQNTNSEDESIDKVEVFQEANKGAIESN
ncbi:hypothetical protein WICMUC_002045 [Wickerhamomyces mucosus]|uniref:Major facilitator superfamily (MFS) profile domain-containing protein n=1 Tax=Wickerhamomyces mucosus TaxID=1378264 RepID=A0A9P8TF15_9ASCO|nr:hypothetical protein WICMUC_002045 [Wickerhamomyces mucosus]